MMKNLSRLTDRLRRGTGRVLERAGLSGGPILCLPREQLEVRGYARRVLDAVAASRRELPSLLDVLTDRGVPLSTVLLTVDATSPAVIDELVPALAAHETACRLFVRPDALDGPGGLRADELRAALGYGVVTGLALPDDLDARGAHALRGDLTARATALTALTGSRCDTAATLETPRSEVLRAELHRAGFRRLYVGQTGLATADAWMQPRLVLGRDVEPEDLRELLDLDGTSLSAAVGRMRARGFVAARR